MLFFPKNLTGLKNYHIAIILFKSICDKLGLLLRGFTKSLHSKKYVQVNFCENRKIVCYFPRHGLVGSAIAVVLKTAAINGYCNP